MTLTIEYSGKLNPSADETIMNAALVGIGKCQVESTYWDDASIRRFGFQVTDTPAANAMLTRIQQTGLTLSKQEISE